MTDQLYRYSMRDSDKSIEITFLVPPETNMKKHMKIAITKDTISVFDTRQAQPVILGKLYDTIKDSSYHKLEVVRNGENYGEVEITLEKKNRNIYWRLLVLSSKSEKYQKEFIDDQSEFLLSILHKVTDPPLAMECLGNAAEKGNENALLEYACHCSGVPAWKYNLQTVDLSLPEDTAKSIKYFERFLAFHPYHHVALYRLGFLYKNVVKDMAKAKKFLLQSFQRMPYYAEASLALAHIFYDENNEKSCISYYRYALQGGLTDPKLAALVEKLKKEEEEKKLAEEKRKAEEAEAARLKKEEEERAAADVLRLKELEESNAFFNYVVGGIVVTGLAVGAFFYHTQRDNK